MKIDHLKYLVCPVCEADLCILKIEKESNKSIETGTLECTKCKKIYPIVRYVPRFVPLENYASGFGLEWTKHGHTQYDSYSGAPVSETRFFEETKWPRKIQNETILEVGSGSGRFTEQAASTGAMVVSIDYSYAVDANFASNGKKSNVLIIQASIYEMPVRKNFFDKIFCIGVLQHTPNVQKSFLTLPKYLRSGGKLVIDVYRKWLGVSGLLMTKYWIRPITVKINPAKLYNLCKKYIEIMWPIARFLNKLGKYGQYLNWILQIPNYSKVYNLSDQMIKEWAILDCFDSLSPQYDFPQTIDTVRIWFKKIHLENVVIFYGFTGITGRGTKS